MNEPIYSLTVLPPWCWWITMDHPKAKRIENREWKPSWAKEGEPFLLAIHAGMTWAPDTPKPYFGHTAHALRWNRVRRWIHNTFGVDPDEFPTRGVKGAIVAVATCRCFSGGIGSSGPDDPFADGWAVGPWQWKLDDVVVLKTPIAYRGHQGLRQIKDEGVLSQLRHDMKLHFKVEP